MPTKTFFAAHNHARLSPYKARPVIDLVRGKGVNQALSILEYEDRRAAPLIRAVIQSALANASNDLEVKLNQLVVSEARVDGGPPLRGAKQFMSRAMGRAFPIHKRTCHIRVVLTEVAPVKDETKAKGAGSAKKKKSKAVAEGAAPVAGGAPGPAGKKE